MTLVERIQKYLIESNEYESWEQFVDSRSLGECQDIVDDVTREFPKAKKVFGEIMLDTEYLDEEGEEQNIMTHHWVTIDGKLFDFTKGTLIDYINWDDVYDTSVGTDDWRYIG